MTTSMFLFLMSSMMMPHADNNAQIMIMVMMMIMMTMTLVANPTANVGGLQMLQHCHSASIYLVLSFFSASFEANKKITLMTFFLKFFCITFFATCIYSGFFLFRVDVFHFERFFDGVPLKCCIKTPGLFWRFCCCCNTTATASVVSFVSNIY